MGSLRCQTIRTSYLEKMCIPLLVDVQGVVGQVLMFLPIFGTFTFANLDFGSPMTDFIGSVCAPFDLNDVFEGLPCIDRGVQMFGHHLLYKCSFQVSLYLPWQLLSSVETRVAQDCSINMGWSTPLERSGRVSEWLPVLLHIFSSLSKHP